MTGSNALAGYHAPEDQDRLGHTGFDNTLAINDYGITTK